MSHLGWYTNSARWAFGDIAAMIGVILEAVQVPAPRPSGNAPTFGHLVYELSNRGPALPVSDEQRGRLFRLARHLRRVDGIGRQFEADDLADACRLVGHRVESADLDASLVSSSPRLGRTGMPTSWASSIVGPVAVS